MRRSTVARCCSVLVFIVHLCGYPAANGLSCYQCDSSVDKRCRDVSVKRRPSPCDHIRDIRCVVVTVTRRPSPCELFADAVGCGDAGRHPNPNPKPPPCDPSGDADCSDFSAASTPPPCDSLGDPGCDLSAFSTGPPCNPTIDGGCKDAQLAGNLLPRACDSAHVNTYCVKEVADSDLNNGSSAAVRRYCSDEYLQVDHCSVGTPS